METDVDWGWLGGDEASTRERGATRRQQLCMLDLVLSSL